MNPERSLRLRRNARLLFWTQALLNVNIFNVVSTLFFLQRGLSLPQLIQTAVVWGAANMLFEVPSSYMADRWGRKKTLVVGVLLSIACDAVWLFGHGFFLIFLGFFLNGLAYACFTGTDEALLYDSQRELGEEEQSLKKFGHYDSAQNIAKIITPFLGALLARNLTEWQFFFGPDD